MKDSTEVNGDNQSMLGQVKDPIIETNYESNRNLQLNGKESQEETLNHEFIQPLSQPSLNIKDDQNDQTSTVLLNTTASTETYEKSVPPTTIKSNEKPESHDTKKQLSNATGSTTIGEKSAPPINIRNNEQSELNAPKKPLLKGKKLKKKKSKAERNKILEDYKRLKRDLTKAKSELQEKDKLIAKYKATIIEKGLEIKQWQNANLQLQTKVYEKMDEYGKFYNKKNFLFNKILLFRYFFKFNKFLYLDYLTLCARTSKQMKSVYRDFITISKVYSL